MVQPNNHEYPSQSGHIGETAQAALHVAGEASETYHRQSASAVGYAVRKIRIVSIAFVAVMATALTSLAVATPNQDDINRAKEHERATERSVAAIEADLAQANADLRVKEQERDVAEQEYADVRSVLEARKAQKVQAEKKLAQARVELEEARKKLGDVARSVYTSQGSLSQAEPILVPDGLHALQTKNMAVSYFGNKASADVKKFERLQKEADEAATKVDKAVKEQEDAAKSAQNQLTIKQAAFNTYQQNAQTINAKRDELIAELAQARGVTVALERERQQSIEQQRRAEEQARQKALAEKTAAEAKARAEAQAKAAAEAKARAQAEAKAKAAAQKPATKPAPKPAPKPAAKPTPKPQPKPKPAPKPAPKPQPKPAPKPAPSANAKKQAIVDMAMQYVGGRYIWGGTTPRGFDCSGLVQYVYRHAAGVNLPRIASAQGRYGKTITRAQAVPGDIVYFPAEHVGIYIGNNRVLHASSPSRGIRIDNLTYRPNHRFVRIF